MGEWFQSYEREVKDELPVFVSNVFLLGAFDLKLSKSLAREFLSRVLLTKSIFSWHFGQECYVTKGYFVSKLSLCWQYVCIFFRNHFTDNWMKLVVFIVKLWNYLELVLSKKERWQNSKSWGRFLKCLNKSTTLSRFTNFITPFSTNVPLFNKCTHWKYIPEVFWGFQGI